MEYNTQRNQLSIVDYGRSVVKLIEHAKTLPTKEQRNAAAEAIVNTMSRVNGHVRQTEGHQRIVWEHMMILANWDFDIDCPYPLERKERVSFHPRHIGHTLSPIQFPHYGNCIESTIRKVAEMPEGEEREYLTALHIAQMKKSYIVWNRAVPDHSSAEEYRDVVLRQLGILSQDRLQEGTLRFPVTPGSTRVLEQQENKKSKKKKHRK